MGKLIIAGTHVCCIECGLIYLTVERDTEKSEVIRQLEDYTPGQMEVRCRECNMPYVYEGKIHTSKGWL